jgi:hypothetical protein
MDAAVSTTPVKGNRSAHVPGYHGYRSVPKRVGLWAVLAAAVEAGLVVGRDIQGRGPAGSAH